MAETQSVEMKDSTEPAHKEPEERQTRYSQEETDRLEGDGVWQSFRTACIKQGNACRTKDSMPTPEAVLEHFERMEDRNRPRKY
ncbi:hypothetical protein FOMA001_g5197 [Fusarium oxysporum f. sp. matthiolae]|nr:hypothetical protein FOMA001_g5197 [Fusarium oxysporum f. sp. matthiolae]